MTIIQITSLDQIDDILSIITTHGFNDDQMEPVRKQLEYEVSKAGDNRLIYAAVENDQYIAMVQLILKNADNDPTLADGKNICHAHNLWVCKDHLRKGIGVMMMNHIEDVAREMGKKIMTLGVDSTNRGAMKLYDKIGYKTFREDPGRTPDEICYMMKKAL